MRLHLEILLLALAFALVCLLCGCRNLPAIIRAASKDPAEVHMKVGTIYGTFEYDRKNPGAVLVSGCTTNCKCK